MRESERETKEEKSKNNIMICTKNTLQIERKLAECNEFSLIKTKICHSHFKKK
jgi:hypothetical protein